jgi:hypothetical protein
VHHLLHPRDTRSASARRSRATLRFSAEGFAMEDAPEGNVMSPIGKKAILVDCELLKTTGLVSFADVARQAENGITAGRNGRSRAPGDRRPRLLARK